MHYNQSDPTWAWNRKPMVGKRILSAQYFYFNTTAMWYILMTDNAFLFLENLKEMLADLSRQWQPEEESVILGNCMSQGGRPPFLQGGTGWLMSRKAVGDFLKIAPVWFQETSTSEDVHFTAAMRQINLSVKEATSPYFLGQYLYKDDYDLMEGFNFSKLYECPKVNRILCTACKPFVAPFRKIVFFHHLSLMRLRRPPHPMAVYPADLGWYMCDEFPHFCKLQ
jgi:hypothetical protein